MNREVQRAQFSYSMLQLLLLVAQWSKKLSFVKRLTEGSDFAITEIQLAESKSGLLGAIFVLLEVSLQGLSFYAASTGGNRDSFPYPGVVVWMLH